ncbi:hypothetical protein BC834DRAFT_116896 [Gloeopeniophorella convolvens]|nr:hypothetical protein BC834DRAFT_116896 [Gloeopeniophorella convolvens]
MCSTLVAPHPALHSLLPVLLGDQLPQRLCYTPLSNTRLSVQPGLLSQSAREGSPVNSGLSPWPSIHIIALTRSQLLMPAPR